MKQICRLCNESKYIDEFHFKNKRKGIRHNYCKNCRVDVNKEYYKQRKIFVELGPNIPEHLLRFYSIKWSTHE